MSKLEVFTIGYEGSKIEDFVQVLADFNIDALVDIRELPASRKPGFSKKALQFALEDAGIEYVHLRPLGDPKEGRDAARSGDYDRFRRIFSTHLKSELSCRALRDVVTLMDSKTICLMCFERDHNVCHRKIVVDELKKMCNFSVKHIGVPKDYARKAA